MILYMVRKNADMTEGRGPMVQESIWFDRKKAIEHMDKQPGIMGHRPKSGSWDTEKYCSDWDIVDVFTMDDPPKSTRVIIHHIFTEDRMSTLCGTDWNGYQGQAGDYVELCSKCHWLLIKKP